MSLAARLKAFFGIGRNDDVQTVRIVASGSTPSGTYVNADTALKNATVWACVNYLARTIGQLPWRVLQDLGDAAPRRVPLHPVGKLLALRPNPEMSAFTFRETMVGWATRYGNAVAEIVTDNRNVPVSLWPLHPTRVEFARDDKTGALVYVVTGNDGEKCSLDGSRVMHVKGFGEGVVGLDVISYAAESIGWSRATEVFGATFFANGANPSGFLTFEGRLSAAAKDNVEAELKRKHGGAAKGNRVMILDNGWKFDKSAVEPDAAQFIETRQHQVEEICRWFGVPPHKVMHMLRSTFANIEHQSIEVVVDSIAPWALRFEQEADYKLFGANRQGFFTKLDLKGLLRGDFKSRQEGLQLMRRNGVINGNEWRRLEDMDEIGPHGDKYIVEGNMTTLERVGEAAVAKQVAAGDPQDDSTTSPAVERARQQAARALLH